MCHCYHVFLAMTAICMPPCQNLGFCLAPNLCECPDGFEGPQCQFAKSKPCLDKPPTPMNSRVVCNEKECISTCNKGFTFPGGSKKLTLICDAGAWTPRVQQPAGQSKKVPDCQREYYAIMMNRLAARSFTFSSRLTNVLCNSCVRSALSERRSLPA